MALCAGGLPNNESHPMAILAHGNGKQDHRRHLRAAQQEWADLAPVDEPARTVGQDH